MWMWSFKVCLCLIRQWLLWYSHKLYVLYFYLPPYEIVKLFYFLKAPQVLEKNITLLEGPQASPIFPSIKRSIMVEISREQWWKYTTRKIPSECYHKYDINLTGIEPRRLVTNYLSHVFAYLIILSEMAVLHMFQVSWGSSGWGQVVSNHNTYSLKTVNCCLLLRTIIIRYE